MQVPIIVAIMGSIRMATATLNMVRLDRRQRASLQLQLYRQLRDLIISGKLQAGVRVPSTRDLVGQLGISRNTIVYALDRLVSEGYLNTRVGSGTYISDLKTPDLGMAERTLTAARQPVGNSSLATRLLTVSTSPPYPSGKVRPFRPCQPAVDRFPIRNWNRARA